MKALDLLYSVLYNELPDIHLARLKALIAVVEGALQLPMLSITWVGRAVQSSATMKHRIKRVDRLVGNKNLNLERREIYSALARVLLKEIPKPIILVDWSDLPNTDRWHILRASLPVGGRGLVLYEELHPQALYGNRMVHNRFLARLKALLPEGANPIIIADAGFRVPFYRECSKLGFDWIGRILNRDFIAFPRAGEQEWKPAQGLFGLATGTPKRLGSVRWVRSNPMAAELVLYKRKPKGRRKMTRAGNKARSHHSTKNAKREQSPWLLVYSPSLASCSARQIVSYYRLRMQIEEAFRDTKSMPFGAGLEASYSRSKDRIANLLLVAHLANLANWLLGEAMQRLGLDQGYIVNTKTSGKVLSTVFLGRVANMFSKLKLPYRELKRDFLDLARYIKSIHGDYGYVSDH